MTFSRTVLTGQATANATGSTPVILDNTSVIQKTLSSLSVSYGQITSGDSIVSAFSRVVGNTPNYIGTGSKRITISPLANDNHPITCEDKAAYAVYVGHFIINSVVDYVKWLVLTDGTGGGQQEVGIFTSEFPPNGGSLTLKKRTATSAVLSGTGIISNIDPFGIEIDANTHVWAVIRTNFGSTQPEIVSLTLDRSKGFILYRASVDDLTTVDAFDGDVIDFNIAQQCPALDVYLN